MIDETLPKCPTCGAAARVFLLQYGYLVGCSTIDCPQETREYADEETARDAWCLLTVGWNLVGTLRGNDALCQRQ